MEALLDMKIGRCLIYISSKPNPAFGYVDRILNEGFRCVSA
jgi:hypothetical protein